jgi:hypothetical protein
VNRERHRQTEAVALSPVREREKNRGREREKDRGRERKRVRKREGERE